MVTALTDHAYWDVRWRATDATDVVRIEHKQSAYHAAVDGALAKRLAPGRRFIEIGAGGSAWPAWAMERYGAEAWGIDFSRAGLELVRAAAGGARPGLELVEGDLFDRSLLPAGHFDVVFSGGFVEHFPEPAALMKRLLDLVAPGGLVVTTVPNLVGLNGWLQARVDPDVYSRHVVFDPRSLDAAHRSGGLHPVEPARYLGLLDVGAVNLDRMMSRLPPLGRRLAWGGLMVTHRSAEALGRLARRSDSGPFLAPALIGVYGR